MRTQQTNSPALCEKAQSFAGAFGPDGYGLLRVLGFPEYVDRLPDTPPPLSGIGLDMAYALCVSADHMAVNWLAGLEAALRDRLKQTTSGTRKWERYLADIAQVCSFYNIRWIKLYDIPAVWEASLAMMARRQYNLEIRFGNRRR